MNFPKAKFRISLALLAGVAVWITACDPSPQGSVTDEDINQVEVDSNKTGVVNVAGELFSIPSPIQTAVMISNSGTDYDSDLGSDPSKIEQYTSRQQKAVNLGIYGADLGYATVFEDNELALKYLKAVRELANDLEVTGAMDKKLLERFSNNVGNRDSMLILTSNFYRAGDAYLKDNDRADIASLILAGGWIQAAHYTCDAAQGGNEDARNRLAEQRTAIENLVEVLSMMEGEEMTDELLADFRSLKELYSTITYSYQYEKPETYPEEKITFIKSSTSSQMPDTTLKQISELVKMLRNKTAG